MRLTLLLAVILQLVFLISFTESASNYRVKAYAQDEEPENPDGDTEEEPAADDEDDDDAESKGDPVEDFPKLLTELQKYDCEVIKGDDDTQFKINGSCRLADVTKSIIKFTNLDKLSDVTQRMIDEENYYLDHRTNITTITEDEKIVALKFSPVIFRSKKGLKPVFSGIKFQFGTFIMELRFSNDTYKMVVKDFISEARIGTDFATIRCKKMCYSANSKRTEQTYKVRFATEINLGRVAYALSENKQPDFKGVNPLFNDTLELAAGQNASFTVFPLKGMIEISATGNLLTNESKDELKKRFVWDKMIYVSCSKMMFGSKVVNCAVMGKIKKMGDVALSKFVKIASNHFKTLPIVKEMENSKDIMFQSSPGMMLASTLGEKTQTKYNRKINGTYQEVSSIFAVSGNSIRYSINKDRYPELGIQGTESDKLLVDITLAQTKVTIKLTPEVKTTGEVLSTMFKDYPNAENNKLETELKKYSDVLRVNQIIVKKNDVTSIQVCVDVSFDKGYPLISNLLNLNYTVIPICYEKTSKEISFDTESDEKFLDRMTKIKIGTTEDGKFEVKTDLPLSKMKDLEEKLELNFMPESTTVTMIKPDDDKVDEEEEETDDGSSEDIEDDLPTPSRNKRNAVFNRSTKSKSQNTTKVLKDSKNKTKDDLNLKAPSQEKMKETADKYKWPKEPVKIDFQKTFPNFHKIFIKEATVNGIWKCPNSFIKGNIKMKEQNATMELVYRSIESNTKQSGKRRRGLAALCLEQKMKVKDPCDQTTEEKVDELEDSDYADEHGGSIMDMIKKTERGGSLPWLLTFAYKFPQRRYNSVLQQFRKIVISVQAVPTFYSTFREDTRREPKCKYIEREITKNYPVCKNGIMIHAADLELTCSRRKSRSRIEQCNLYRKFFVVDTNKETFFDADYYGCMKPHEFRMRAKFQRNVRLAGGIRIVDAIHEVIENMNPTTGVSLRTRSRIKGKLDIDRLPKSCSLKVIVEFIGNTAKFTIRPTPNAQQTTLLGIPFVEEMMFRSSKSDIVIDDECIEMDSPIKVGRITGSVAEGRARGLASMAQDNRLTFDSKSTKKLKQRVCSKPSKNEFYAELRDEKTYSVWRIMQAFLSSRKIPKTLFKNKDVYNLKATYHERETPVKFSDQIDMPKGLWLTGRVDAPTLRFDHTVECKKKLSQQNKSSNGTDVNNKKSRKKNKKKGKKNDSKPRQRREAEKEKEEKKKNLQPISFYSNKDQLIAIIQLPKIYFATVKDKKCTPEEILKVTKNKEETIEGPVMKVTYSYLDGFVSGYIQGYFSYPMFSSYGRFVLKDTNPSSCEIKNDNDPTTFEFRPMEKLMDEWNVNTLDANDDVEEEMKIAGIVRVSIKGKIVPTDLTTSRFWFKLTAINNLTLINQELEKMFVETDENFFQRQKNKVSGKVFEFEQVVEKELKPLYNNKKELQEEVEAKRSEIESLNEKTELVCGENCDAVALPGFEWQNKGCRYSKDLRNMPCLHFSPSAHLATDVDCLLKCESNRKVSNDHASSKRHNISAGLFPKLKVATGLDRLAANIRFLLQPAYPKELSEISKKIQGSRPKYIKVQNDDTVFSGETKWRPLREMRTLTVAEFTLRYLGNVEKINLVVDQTLPRQIARHIFMKYNEKRIKQLNADMGNFHALLDESNITFSRFEHENKNELRRAKETGSLPVRRSEEPRLSDYIGINTGFVEDPYETNYLMNNHAPWNVLKKGDPLSNIPVVNVKGSLEKKSGDACTETRHKVANFRDILKYMRSWTSSFKKGYSDMSRLHDNIKRGVLKIQKKIVKRAVVENIETKESAPLNRWIEQTKKGFESYVKESATQLQQMNMYGPRYMKQVLSNVYTPQNGESFEALLYRSSQEADATFRKTFSAQDKPFENVALTMINFWRQNNTLLQMAPVLDNVSTQLKVLDKRTIGCKH